MRIWKWPKDGTQTTFPVSRRRNDVRGQYPKLPLIHTHYYLSNLIWWVGSRLVAAPGTTGSHSTSSRVIRSFLAQPLDVIRSIRSSNSSNNVFIINQHNTTKLISVLAVNSPKLIPCDVTLRSDAVMVANGRAKCLLTSHCVSMLRQRWKMHLSCLIPFLLREINRG